MNSRFSPCPILFRQLLFVAMDAFFKLFPCYVCKDGLLGMTCDVICDKASRDFLCNEEPIVE